MRVAGTRSDRESVRGGKASSCASDSVNAESVPLSSSSAPAPAMHRPASLSHLATPASASLRQLPGCQGANAPDTTNSSARAQGLRVEAGSSKPPFLPSPSSYPELAIREMREKERTPERQGDGSVEGKGISGEGREARSGEARGVMGWEGMEVGSGEVELSTCHVLIAADAQLVEEVCVGVTQGMVGGGRRGRRIILPFRSDGLQELYVLLADSFMLFVFRGTEADLIPMSLQQCACSTSCPSS